MKKPMTKQNETNNSNTESKAVIEIQEIEKNSIDVYYDEIRRSYENERLKGTAFDNRIGILITMVSIIILFIIEKINLKEFLKLFQVDLTFLMFLKIFSGIIVFFSIIYILYNVYGVIKAQSFLVFNHKTITSTRINERSFIGKKRMMNTYAILIQQNREINNKKSKKLNKAIEFTGILILSLLLFLNI